MVLTCHLVEVLVFFEIFGFLDVYALSATPRFLALGWAGRMPIRIIRCITILPCHGSELKKSPQGLCDVSLSPLWISGFISNIQMEFLINIPRNKYNKSSMDLRVYF